MIVIAGVLGLAATGLVVAVLSAVAASAPDRAALMVVLGAAGAGVAAFLMLLVSTLLFGLGAPPAAGDPLPSVTVPSLPRLVTALAVAALLVVIAGVLIRTGDWERPEDDVLDQ